MNQGRPPIRCIPWDDYIAPTAYLPTIPPRYADGVGRGRHCLPRSITYLDTPDRPNHLNLFWLPLALIVAAGVSLAFRRQSRHSVLDRLQREWGAVEPDRPFDPHLASESWRELGDCTPGLGIDPHTWADLHLDDVLAHIDRTQTALGSQTLYRRFRSGSAWSSCPELETLATRFATDPRLREQVGLILARGGRSLGRGLWIITRPELISIRWWYWLFPMLSVTMIVSLVAIPFQPVFLLVACAAAFLNMIIRGVTQWQVPGLLAPMRQMAPLIRTARRLGQIPALLETQPENLSEDVRRLLPLRRIAAWVTRDSVTMEERSVTE